MELAPVGPARVVGQEDHDLPQIGLGELLVLEGRLHLDVDDVVQPPADQQPDEQEAPVAEGQALAVPDLTEEVVGRVDEERSDERRVGKECVSTCRYRWWPYH